MFARRKDSIKELREKEREEQQRKEDAALALDGVAELGVIVAQLLEAQQEVVANGEE